MTNSEDYQQAEYLEYITDVCQNVPGAMFVLGEIAQSDTSILENVEEVVDFLYTISLTGIKIWHLYCFVCDKDINKTNEMLDCLMSAHQIDGNCDKVEYYVKSIDSRVPLLQYLDNIMEYIDMIPEADDQLV